MPHSHKVTELFPEADPMEANRLYEKLDSKLDDVVRGMSSLAQDVARMQGTQVGMVSSVDILGKAIGDVTQTRVEAAATAATLMALTKRLDDCENKLEAKENKIWVESLIKSSLIALGVGAGGAGGYALLQRVLG